MGYPLFVSVHPEGVHAGVNKDNQEWQEQVKQQPDVNHLDIGGLGKAVGHIDEDGCQYKHRGQVDCDHSLVLIRIDW